MKTNTLTILTVVALHLLVAGCATQKAAKAAAPTSPDPGMAIVAKEPRPHHYLFAHRVLPALFFEDPAKVAEGLRLHGAKLVEFFWHRTARFVEPSDRVAAEGIALSIHRIGEETELFVIQCPRAEAMTEAYFVGLVVGPRAPAFLTLEFSYDIFENRSCTVLGEWDLESGHSNHGEGPAPSEELFARAVVEHLAKGAGGAGAAAQHRNLGPAPADPAAEVALPSQRM